MTFPQFSHVQTYREASLSGLTLVLVEAERFVHEEEEEVNS